MRGLALGLLALAACSTPDRVVVGSKNFTEQRLLGELLAQTVESVGLRADRRLDLGGTFVCDRALRAGQIDAYVEYTGTALIAILEQAPDTDPVRVREQVARAYEAAGLVWTAPLGFDNTFALVVRGEEAERLGIRTISEAVVPARGWRAAVGYEFNQRADGLPSLTRTYGIEFADVRVMDLGLIYRALADGQVELAVGSATDGPIARLGLRILADDRRAFPPYEAAPVVRRATLERFPALRGALDRLGGRLAADTIRALNEETDGQRRDPAVVIREWRARVGL